MSEMRENPTNRGILIFSNRIFLCAHLKILKPPCIDGKSACKIINLSSHMFERFCAEYYLKNISRFITIIVTKKVGRTSYSLRFHLIQDLD